jgi:hypothetical protein
MIRLTVLFDFDTDDLSEAYTALHKRLLPGEGIEKLCLGWETANEWYSDSGDGPGDEKTLDAAILSVLKYTATCDNCGVSTSNLSLNPIKHYDQRVDPFGQAPAGECPECGCLCYMDE